MELTTNMIKTMYDNIKNIEDSKDYFQLECLKKYKQDRKAHKVKEYYFVEDYVGTVIQFTSIMESILEDKDWFDVEFLMTDYDNVTNVLTVHFPVKCLFIKGFDFNSFSDIDSTYVPSDDNDFQQEFYFNYLDNELYLGNI